MIERLTLPAMTALVGILPVSLLLFLFLRPRHAAVATYLLGWLFLPQARIEIPGALPDWDRVVAISLSVLGGVVVLEPSRLARLRPSLLDLPVLCFCVATPLASSITNGLGAYDGLAAALNSLFSTALPYLVGRIYFNDAEGQRALVVAIFLAGLLYVPLCLWEMRLSPQLHRTLYGFHQHTFYQSFRLGGYRPIVFLQHGLAVGMLMSCATLMGVWLWTTRSLTRWQGELSGALLVLAVTTVLCKSLGALLLLAAGTGALLAVRHLGTALPLLCLTLVPPGYVALRTSGVWDTGETLVLVEETVGTARAESVGFRWKMEELLVAKALEQPLFGWGGWDRGKVETEAGKKAIADGMWIIVLGRYGFFGLLSYGLLYALPVWLFLRAAGPPGAWARPELAPAAGLAAMVSIYQIDNLMNAMFSPFNLLALGGLTGWTLARRSAGRLAAQSAAGDPWTAAVRRWGHLEVQRREQLARAAAAALGDERAPTYAERYLLLLLALEAQQVDDFLRHEAEEQRALVDRWLGLSVEVPQPASA